MKIIRKLDAFQTGCLVACFFILGQYRELRGATYDVGPGEPYTTIASVPAPGPGDLIQIHCGVYNEVRRWTTSGTAAAPITLKGVCATALPLIDATGQSVTGDGSIPRAIWQIEGSNYVIDGLEFKNARNGNNGAGIRVMNASVTIQNVRITYCDMGILTSTTSADNVLVQNSEIAYNGTGALDGQSHNVYLTQGGTITFQFCYVHDAVSGTNVKSRAHYSQLFYNYISYGAQNEVEGVDEQDTTTPNSNMTMIGNVLVSMPNRTLNTSQFINFGQDVGGTHAGTLYLINNTLIAGSSSIGFLRSSAPNSAILAVNNIFFGSNTIVQPGYTTGVSGNNNWTPATAAIPASFSASTTGAAPGFLNAGQQDFHLVAGSSARNIGFNTPIYLDGNGVSHSGIPLFQYVNQLGSTPRTADGSLDAGAYEFSTAVAPPTQGLIGYWNLDEGSGTVAHDTSGSGHNGTVWGALWVPGKINSALSFNNGTSYVVTSSIPMASTFSISAWVNPAVTNQVGYARIAETQYNGGFYLGTDGSGTMYKFIVNTGYGSTGSCGAGYGCAQGGSITSGWHLLTATFDGMTAELYVDTTLVASDTFTAPGNTNYPLYIGMYYGGGYGWDGVLDEVRLYGRALSSSEVSAIYSSGGIPAPTPPTVSITAPAANATLSGLITVSASASGTATISDVRFQLDGVNLGADLTVAPYSILWDTTTVSNGTHTLSAIATDTSHNTTTSSPVTVVVSNAAAAGPPIQGLIGYWNFDEASGTVAHDTSGGGYNGTVWSALWVPGKINSALSFNNGTSYVVTPGIPMASTFSISAWVNPAVTNQVGYARIAETQYNGGFYLGTDGSGTTYKFIVNTGYGSTGSCGAGYGCAQGGSITSGWHLLTATFDGAKATLYLDGAAIASDTFTPPPAASFPLYIGRYYGGAGYGWYGGVDEVRLYNRALTPAEVSSIYTGH